MKLSDSNRYWLPGQKQNALHLATVQDGVREFMCFYLRATGQIYIEEITGGHLQRIEDDNLAEALSFYLTYMGVLRQDRPLLPDDEWLRNPNERQQVSFLLPKERK